MDRNAPECVDQLDGVLDCQGVLEVPRAFAPSRHIILGHLGSQSNSFPLV